jgi:methionyl-tRNA formyltransferase
VQIDWHKPLQEVWNLIRGADPQPGAWTIYNGATVQIYEAKKRVGPTTGQPGAVTAVSDASFTIAVAGGQLEVLRVRSAGGQKISAAAFANSVGLRPGVQLGG